MDGNRRSPFRGVATGTYVVLEVVISRTVIMPILEGSRLRVFDDHKKGLGNPCPEVYEVLF